MVRKTTAKVANFLGRDCIEVQNTKDEGEGEAGDVCHQIKTHSSVPTGDGSEWQSGRETDRQPDADRTITSFLPSQFPFVDKYAQEPRDTVVVCPSEIRRTGNNHDRLSHEKKAHVLSMPKWNALWHRDKGGSRAAETV